jgi:seryl-tRNA synthetase
MEHGRGFYLIEEGALLNEALQRFGIAFLRKRGYKAIRTPYIMTKEAMGKCAQLSQYDEELYKVEGEGKLFIATAEQPLAVLHQGEQFHPDQLPIRYVGFSTCFRKEAGSHGRDTAGIFRTHEFEKVEQFCITSPDGNDSWEMHEETIRNAEDFYKELGIAGHVVNVVWCS